MLYSDGFWGYLPSCRGKRYCTVCSIINTPVFSIHGICQESLFVNFNYYAEADIEGNLFFDGYKGARIHKLGSKWQFQSHRDPNGNMTAISDNMTFSPVGRFWWDVYEPSCDMKGSEEIEVALSMCEFGEEFTCDSGQCVNIYKKCDGVKDCWDGSDETSCHFVSISNSYRKIHILAYSH